MITKKYYPQREATKKIHILLVCTVEMCHQKATDTYRKRVSDVLYTELTEAINLHDIEEHRESYDEFDDLPRVEQPSTVDSVNTEITKEELEDAEKEAEALDAEPDNDYITDFYTRTFRNIPVLTPDEEYRYASLLKWGTAEEKKMAKDKLVYHNMRYVLKIAGKYIGLGNDYDDLVQSGLIGLIRAIEKYDVSTGYRVTTYATWWIKQAIARDLADNSRTIRLPVHIQDTAKRIQSAERMLQAEGVSGDELIKRISAMTKIPEEKIRYILKTKPKMVSLDTPISSDGIGGDGESVLEDFVADEQSESQETIVERNDMKREVRDCIDACLTGREKEVITMRFGLANDIPMTLEQIGEVLHVTRERVRQIEGNALRKLRNPKYIKILSVFREG